MGKRMGRGKRKKGKKMRRKIRKRGDGGGERGKGG